MIIGIDRCTILRYPLKRADWKDKHTVSIFVAWTLSAIFAIPQVRISLNLIEKEVFLGARGDISEDRIMEWIHNNHIKEIKYHISCLMELFY